MASILACIVARNHEWSIRKAIRSTLSVADKAVLIDCDSSDKTVEVARQLGVDAVPCRGGESCLEFFLSRSDWLMFLSGNEELSPDLQAEIGYIFQGELQDLYRAYEFNVVTMGRREFTTRGLAYRSRFIRLYRRSFFEGIFPPRRFDECLLQHRWSGEQGVYPLGNDLILRSGISLDYLVDRANFSSSLQAYHLRGKVSKAPSLLAIIFSAIGVLLQTYLVKRYFIFGFTGFVDSCVAALRQFLFLVKLREECGPNNRRT